MKILVLAATANEIQPFRDIHPNADTCITGVGSPHTMYYLMKALAKTKYDLVLQCGVAGTFQSDMPLGSVVLVEKDCFADLGANEKDAFHTLHDLGLANKNNFPYLQGWLVNKNPFLKSSDLPHAKAITVNLLSNDPVWMERLKQAYQPDIETMEGAALHLVCLMEGVQFLQIRGISNLVGDRNKSNWKMKEAIDASNQQLTRIYQQYL